MSDTHATVAAFLPGSSPESGSTGGRGRTSRRLLLAIVGLVLLLLLALLPPYINVNHYQRRIVSSISSSLGRPVHLDNITLHLLPLPSFTLENFVVDEDPAFGAEPVIRANSVTASLRASSLWRRRVEFSTISFQEPSVNLVHNPDGKWNLDAILLQASRVTTAPTGEKHAGPAPRFPYIEATGARLNLKLGSEKTPFSLTEADFALWQGDPSQWHFRLKATPARTDTYVTDTGVLELDATLGRAPTLREVPLTLHATWKSAPLGQTSRLLLGGEDAGLRGDMALAVEAAGTVGTAAIHTHLHLRDLRRDQFVPEHPLTVDIDCLSDARNQFHTFAGIRCLWPVAGTDHAIVALTGSIPDLRTPRLLDLQLGTTRLPANTLVEWLHIASSRTPPGLAATGYLNGALALNSLDPTPNPWSWQATLGPLSITSPSLSPAPLSVGQIDLASASPVPPSSRHPTPSVPAATAEVTLPPTPLDLGGKEPALLEGHFNQAGYHLHLSGSVLVPRLLALGATLPFFGDGLPGALPTVVPSAGASSTNPTRLELFAERAWGASQVWSATPAKASPVPVRHRRAFHR